MLHEQSGYHWENIGDFFLGVLLKSGQKIEVWLIADKNMIRYRKTCVRVNSITLIEIDTNR
jgi:hypothetical protein